MEMQQDRRKDFQWSERKKENRSCVWREEEETIPSSCFIQLVSQIQTTCAGRATSSQDRMKRGAKRYLPSLWYPPAPPFPPLLLPFFHFTSSFRFTNFLLLCPGISSPLHLLTMWIPALLLWILNISNLCSGQDYTDYYQTGDMGTEVRHCISLQFSV